MVQHLYSVVKCVPNPNTGEFVNIAALVGDPSTGQWQIKRLSDERRVRRIVGPAALGACHQYLVQLESEIDESWEALMHGGGDALGKDWLQLICDDHRNVVQFTPPMAVNAEDIDGALEQVFRFRLADTPVERRPRVITKHTMKAALRDAYRDVDLPSGYLHEGVDLVVGANVHGAVDFAIANGQAFQLAQAWSFQLTGIDDLVLQIKAWAYAIDRLRQGERAKLLRGSGVSDVGREVEVDVVVAEPLVSEQTEVFAEASQVFEELGAKVYSWDKASAVAHRAHELVSSAT